MSGRRFVIVGDGAAGLTAARHLRLRDMSASIVMVADDAHPAYYRAALTNYLLGELRDDQLWAVPPGFFSDHRIERRHARATSVDVEGRALRLYDGTELPFDALLVASGARARPPPFEGAGLRGVTTLRTLQDAQAILDAVLVHQAKRAVVVGGGPLAVELATALCERSLAVTLLVRQQALLAGALDAVASDLVVARLGQLGVDVRMGDEIVEVEGDGTKATAVRTKRGATLPSELVGVAIGVLPNSEWIVGAGLRHERGNIVVDEHMRTSVANIWAAGDVAKPPGPQLSLWEPAQLQGRTAALSMTGRDEAYRVGAFYFATRLGDLDFASVGITDDAKADEVMVDRAASKGAMAYRKLWLADGRLVGALMLGHRGERVRARGRSFRKLIDRAVDVAAVKRDLFDPHFDVRSWLGRAELLVPRPELPAAPVRSPASIRGTQTIRIDTREPELAPTQVAPAAMLSVGLRAPVTRALRLRRAGGFLESSEARYPLELATVILGRDRLCDIVLENAAVSYRHASVTQHRQLLYLRDLGSRHGTWVNGAMVTTPHPLQHGDQIRVGGVELVFKSSDPSEQPGRASGRASAAALSRRAYLEGVAGPCLGLRFEVTNEQTTIGRDADATVRLDDISVSRRHAILSGLGDHFTVCDLHSSRGTLKNGRALVPGVDEPLATGDELRLGDTMLRFVVR